MLDAHPSIIVPPEYPVILDLYNKYGKVKHWNKQTVQAFYEDFKKKQPKEFWKYEYLAMNEKSLQESLHKMVGNKTTFSDMVKAFYYHSTSIFGQKNIQLIGDKNPIYASFTDRLYNIFPEAKFIYLTRDYRDNFLSISKFDFEAPNVILQSYRWKYATRKFLSLAGNNTQQFMHIRYEDLVSMPENELGSICHFLNVDYHPAMLEFHKKAHQAVKLVGEEDFNRFHNGLTQAVHNENIYSWRETLPEKDVALADATVGNYAEIMGYRRQFRQSGLYKKFCILPWSLYAGSLYKAMSLAEYLPPGIRKKIATFLPYLAKTYHKLFPNKAVNN